MNKRNPLVSIVITLYNYEIYIKDCIRSIQNQDYSNIEIIVVDDSSSDKSYKRAMGAACKKTTVIRHEKNIGYSSAKNSGIIASKGDYIVMLDADDMLTKDSISSRIKLMLNKNVMFVHAMAMDIGPKTTLKYAYKMNPKKAERRTPRIHAQTVMLSRQVHIEYGLYDETLRSRSDKEMWWRLFGKSDTDTQLIKKVFLKKDVAFYRRHDLSMMRMRKKNKKYNTKVSRLLNKAYKMRHQDGITKDNTRFLAV
jgi:glycosyltransferase involved in cell wall biosynthesis